MMIVVLLAVFFITSADSATYSLSVMTSNGDINPPTYKKIIWGIVVAAIAYILLSAGSLKPLQTISSVSSLQICLSSSDIEMFWKNFLRPALMPMPPMLK